jgi:hypothetical protein
MDGKRIEPTAGSFVESLGPDYRQSRRVGKGMTPGTFSPQQSPTETYEVPGTSQIPGISHLSAIS